MSDNRDSQEPSMEEILSSIRRIIADEQDEDGRDKSAAPSGDTALAEAPVKREEDVLELTDFADDEDEDDDAQRELINEDEPAMAEQPLRTDRRPADEEENEDMVSTRDEYLSTSTADASTNAFARLTKAYAHEESREQPPVRNGERTVEQFMAEMLRPLLKDWLDENLPPLVERVVEQEVKKLARRAELM